jgi:hypothetical protein
MRRSNEAAQRFEKPGLALRPSRRAQIAPRTTISAQRQHGATADKTGVNAGVLDEGHHPAFIRTVNWNRVAATGGPANSSPTTARHAACRFRPLLAEGQPSRPCVRGTRISETGPAARPCQYHDFPETGGPVLRPSSI